MTHICKPGFNVNVWGMLYWRSYCKSGIVWFKRKSSPHSRLCGAWNWAHILANERRSQVGLVFWVYECIIMNVRADPSNMRIIREYVCVLLVGVWDFRVSLNCWLISLHKMKIASRGCVVILMTDDVLTIYKDTPMIKIFCALPPISTRCKECCRTFIPCVKLGMCWPFLSKCEWVMVYSHTTAWRLFDGFLLYMLMTVTHRLSWA